MARGRRRNQPREEWDFASLTFEEEKEPPHVCFPHLRNEIWDLTVAANKSIECPICLETLTSKYQLTVLTCGHKLCGDCWFLMKTKECPVCRR